MPDRSISEKLYSKLLRLYPREFRERFGREMEQNFVDLSRELSVRYELRWLRVAWLFCDAMVQAGRENLESIRRRNAMKSLFDKRRIVALIGVLTIGPGAVMMTLLFLGIEPPLGPFRELLASPPEGPTVLGIGPFVALAVIVVLPVVGVIVTGALQQGKKVVADIRLAALIGIGFTLPLMALQATLGRSSYSTFPILLFGLLWLLAALFTVVAAPTVRAVRGSEGALGQPTLLLVRLLFLILIGIFWAGVVGDQMPCFLGVPNCD